MTRPADANYNRWNDPRFLRVFKERNNAKAEWYRTLAALDTATLHNATDGRGHVTKPEALPGSARAAYDGWLAADAAYNDYTAKE